MKIFKDEELTEAINLESETFNINLGTTMAGGESTHQYWIKNDADADLIQMAMILKPVVEMVEGKVGRDYTKCIQEITINHFPKQMKPQESKMFEIVYTPRVDYFRSLKLGIEIAYTEIPL